MCMTCGCGLADVKIDGHDAGDAHEHVGTDGIVYRHHHAHGSAHEHTARSVRVERDLLATNNRFAAENRQLFEWRGIFALNLVSSPGSGKTSLLVRTIAALRGAMSLAVIEGDQQTSLDAQRIRAAGAAAVQINTGKGCHLDAQRVQQALTTLPLADKSLLFIENVGNLVCPAAFDLGEACKVVVLSVTEGEDKPLKYPDMFSASRLLLLNKCDLLPHLEYDVGRVVENARRVNPAIEILQLSARTGAGMEYWLDWLGGGLAMAGRAPNNDAHERTHV